LTYVKFHRFFFRVFRDFSLQCLSVRKMWLFIRRCDTNWRVVPVPELCQRLGGRRRIRRVSDRISARCA